MKSILSKIATAILLAVLGLSLLIFSGCSKKTTEKAAQKSEEKPALIPLTEELMENFKITQVILAGAQLFSGPDSIILERGLESSTTILGQGGVLIFAEGVPMERQIIAPNTPGVVVKISTDTKTLKIKNLTANFGIGDLILGPATDQDGTFVLYTDLKGLVQYGTSKYELKAGGGVDNPLQILPEFKVIKGSETIAPGRKVGQTTKKKKN